MFTWCRPVAWYPCQIPTNASYCTAQGLVPLPSTVACNTNACPAVYRWVIDSPWQSCNAACGGGSSTRAVSCRRKTDGLLSTRPTTDCAAYSTSVKPATSRTCNSKPCVLAQWAVSAWSSCSAPVRPWELVLGCSGRRICACCFPSPSCLAVHPFEELVIPSVPQTFGCCSVAEHGRGQSRVSAATTAARSRPWTTVCVLARDWINPLQLTRAASARSARRRAAVVTARATLSPRRVVASLAIRASTVKFRRLAGARLTGTVAAVVPTLFWIVRATAARARWTPTAGAVVPAAF